MTLLLFPRWPLWASLFAFFALTAALIIVVPLGKSPDEEAHWQYVQHIAQTGQLPIFRGAAPPAPGYEFHQPPLYYLLSAPLWKLAGAGAQNYACRAVSLVFGLGTILLIWNAARLLFPQNWRVAAFAAGFGALFPLHQAVSAGSNNDGLAGFLAAALFLLIAKILQNGATRRAAMQLGLLAGLSILTKNTLIVLVFVGFLALLAGTKKPNSKIEFLPALGISLGIALLVGGPWLARNQVLYGDPLALSAFSGAASAVAPGFPLFSSMGMSFFEYARGLLWMIFVTAWGFFGGPNSAVTATVPLGASGPRVTQLELLPLMMACLIAPLLALLGWRKGENVAEESELPTPINAALFKFWALGVVLIVLAWAQFAFSYFAGGQARYLHGALLPLCVLGAAGWLKLWAQGVAIRVASTIFGAILLILTLLNVFVWKTLV